jgi:hypothetical protein
MTEESKIKYEISKWRFSGVLSEAKNLTLPPARSFGFASG